MPERGTIALVPFPFSDLAGTKRRPVLVLSLPDRYGDIVVMPITSRSHHERSRAIRDEDLVSGGLPVQSWIRTDRPLTLNVSLVQKTLATIDESAVADCVSALCGMLGRP